MIDPDDCHQPPHWRTPRPGPRWWHWALLVVGFAWACALVAMLLTGTP